VAGVPLPDQDTEAVLNDARSQAAAALKGRFPDSMLAPPPPAEPRVKSAAPAPAAQPQQALDAQPPGDPGPGAQPLADLPPPPPPPAAAPAPAPGFWADELHGIGRVVANHVMAGFAALGGTLGRTGTGMAMAEDPAHAEDAAKAGHDYIDKVTNDAYQSWVGKANDQQAGGLAQVAGSVAETVPQLLLPAAPVAMPIASADQKANQLMQQGIDPKTAAKEALVTAFATAAGLKISHAFPAFIPAVRATIQHMVTGAVGNTAVQGAQDVLEKYILSSDGYKEAAAQINPTDPSSIAKSGIMGVIFGLINSFTHGGARKAPANTPPDLNVVAGTGEPPPPPTSAAQPVSTPLTPPPVADPGPTAEPVASAMPFGHESNPVKTGGTVVPPEPVASAMPFGHESNPVKLPDNPSAEPIADLKAQVADMKDPNSDRSHVYLSPENVAALGFGGVRELADGSPITRNFDRKGGVLISENFSQRSKAAHLRSVNGDDMQATLGALTGAGEGKTSDQTVVVQGQTPEGAVVKESMVAPAEVPQAVSDVADAGHTPVVTTSDAAIQRREALLANPPVEAKIKAGDLRVIKVGGVDKPVVVKGEPKDNKVSVSEIDEDGNISDQVHDVPRTMFDEPTPTAAERATTEPSEATASPPKGEITSEGSGEATAEPVHPLQAASDFYDKANTPATGKKFAGSVSEHAGRVAALARALQGEIGKFTDASPEVLAHAQAAAERVASVDSKSEEAMAKNRGVGHSILNARGEDIKAAIQNLLHPETAKVPEPVQPKAVTLKAKVVKKAEPVAEAPKPVEKKVSSGIKDTEDFSKPKTLNAGEKARIGAAIGRYMRVDPDNVQSAHDNLQRVLHEVYGDERAHETDQVLALVREQRADEREEHAAARRGTGRMSDTVDEDEFVGKNLSKRDLRGQLSSDDNEHEAKYQYPSVITNSPLGALHKLLAKTGFWDAVAKARRNGDFMSTHRVLDHLIATADTGDAAVRGVMGNLLRKIRAHVSDLPIRPTSRVMGSDGPKGAGTVGLFTGRNGVVQFESHGTGGELYELHALLHEISHSVTSIELHDNPNGAFATEVKRLLAEAQVRAKSMGESHYGLTDEHEFIAEALTNPKFQQFLADSEAFKSEGFQNSTYAKDSLLTRVGRAIARLFGIVKPEESRLLQDVMGTAERGMAEQSASRPEFMNRTGSEWMSRMSDEDFERLTNGDRDDFDPKVQDFMEHAAQNIGKLQDPPPLQHEDKFREAAGNAATAVARGFRATLRSGLIEGLRRTTRALTPYDGMIRAQLRRGTFGHDEPGNPLRDYDEAIQNRNATINKMTTRANPIVAERAKLSTKDDRTLGKFQDDATTMGIDADPKSPLKVSKAVLADKKYPQKLADMTARWNKLTPEQQSVYRNERDYNQWAARQERKAGVDLAIHAYSDKELSPAQRSLLYAAKDPGDFESLVGQGKMIDVGERNDSLKDTLRDISGLNELEGPYFHKGRSGDYVVQIRKDGSKTFDTRAEAEAHAKSITDLSPVSKAKIAEVAGKFQVDTHAEYTSMHEKAADAQAEADRLRSQGFDVGSYTQKILSGDSAPLSRGFENIYAEASRKLDKRLGKDAKTDKAIEDIKTSLRNAFVSQMAARSAYAGSKLARRNVGGVKPEEMGRNFATHAQSQAWNVGHMSTSLDVGDALGRLREATKDDTQTQSRALQRGRIYDEIQRRLRQEVSQYGSHQPLNSAFAKLGFLNYMTSPSHALLYLTQNFTTAIPTAASRFGFGRTASAFGAAMRMISGPAFRETYRSLIPFGKGHDVNTIQRAILGAVAKDGRFGKWAQGGENAPLQQLIDRGIIHTSLSNQLALAAHGGNQFTNKVMEYARITAAMADMFNRVSTGVAALELHKGDIYKAGDFVKETHVDYSQENKPRAFKAVGKLWGGNSVTMFRSYITGMTHLLYSHIYDLAAGVGDGGRTQALKTVAGLMLGTALFAGVQKGLGLEPIRLAMYAYNKLKGDNDEYYSFDNSVRRAVQAFAGDGKLAEVINGGLPRLLGIDMSSRMGLSDLFFHDPPDVLSLNQDGVLKMVGSLAGAGVQEAADELAKFNKATETGRLDDWMDLIPIKAFHNVLDAYKAGTSGKVTSQGAQITEPSAGAAITHAIGFRTAEEAKLAEQARTEGDYKQWVEQRKFGLLNQWGRTAPEDRYDLLQKMDAFSQANPGNRITASDRLKAQRNVARTEQEAEGVPGRNPVVNELRSH
jgi:hypothetical protein